MCLPSLSTLTRLEAVVDGVSAVLAQMESKLPIGVRPRQLRLRTLVLGILLALADGRPAHLTQVHRALVSLPEAERRRLGVVILWRGRPHLLTYRQTERTFGLVSRVLGGDDGRVSALCQRLLDALAEASIAGVYKDTSSSLALDWTDVESFSRPPLLKGGSCTDGEASWGHRRGEGPGHKDELFFGYYLSLATMVNDERAQKVPELVRCMTLSSCHVDPVPVLADVVVAMAGKGAALGDVLGDSGYAHRVPEHFALALRRSGARLVIDLHPHDRGPQGTHAGTVIANGSLYCPATPRTLLELRPPPRDAGAQALAANDQMTAEADHYRLGRICADDTDGYHRVTCPALSGKVRCPLRPGSMALPHDRPEIFSPPEHLPSCCSNKTITVPPSVAAKTAQKHPYPSAAWRRSYARRTAVERANSTIKDPATTDVARGWCRVMGLAPMSVLLACAIVVRNLRVADAFEARRGEDERRHRLGLAPKVVGAGGRRSPICSSAPPAHRRSRVADPSARAASLHQRACTSVKGAGPAAHAVRRRHRPDCYSKREY